MITYWTFKFVIIKHVLHIFKPKQLISWRRWKDDLSGIEHYNLEVFELFFDGSQLKQREEIITEKTLIDRSKSEVGLVFM